MDPMTTPRLFTPIQLGPVTVRNRAWASPMCQYAVETRDGIVADWHLVQYGNLAASGWGLVMTEATAVSAEGRISPWDAGLWNDEQIAPWRRVTDFAHAQGATIGVQLAHAGRKASTNRWWQGEPSGNVSLDDGGWLPVGPTAERVPGDEYTAEVTALDEAGIAAVIAGFRDAAARALAAGFELVELHAAHGYLLHQFLSPLSNQRSDAYGGPLEHRMRLLLEVFDAVRAAVPDTMTVGVRISATDWVDGGWDLAQSIALARALDARGCHYLHVSSGGLHPAQRIPLAPGYQLPFAEAIRREVAMPVIGVGLITTPEQAEAALAQGQADAIALARALLYDPRWPWHAAAALGATVATSPRFLRAVPHGLPPLLVPVTGTAG